MALVGCEQSLGVICGLEQHLFKTDIYFKITPVGRGMGAPTPQFNARSGGAYAAMCFLGSREIARMTGLGESQTFLRCRNHAI